MKFKVSALLPIPAEIYFIERDSSAFRSLVAESCKLESLEMGNSWMDGDVEVYEFVTKPDIHRYCPHQFKHFLPGGDLHYTDVIAYDPQDIGSSPYRMRVHSIPPIFASKAKIESNLIIEEVTSETCRQTLEGSVEIKIIGLGHVVEKIVVDNLRNVYKGVPHIVERWVKFRNEVLKQPGGKEILIQGRPKNEGVNWINDQIRSLIKAEDSESELSSAMSSTHNSWQQDHLPSVEEMMEQCSLESSSANTDEDNEDEDLVFFDARENPTFMNLSESVQRSLQPINSLDKKMEKDQKDAALLMSNYQKAGHTMRKVPIEPSPSSETTGKAVRGESQRFGPDYNSQLNEWREFWQEHEVPEQKHVKASDFRTRLGHVFGLGADAGMFEAQEQKHDAERKEKKKGHKFHLRNKHKRKDAFKGIRGPREDESTASESLNSIQVPETVHGKEHRHLRSGGFIKDLFTWHKS